MNKNKNSEQLKNEKISKLLYKLALPAVVGMVVNSLYNLIDTIFVGKSEGTLGLAGLALAYPIQMILMSVAMLFGIGASSLLSISIGEEDYEKAKKIVANTYMPLALINFTIMILGITFIEPLIFMFSGTEEVLPYAKDYLTVILMSNILFGTVMSSNNLLRAEGNVKISMILMSIGIFVNIILDPIFIFDWGLGLGVKGAAYATAIGQLCSFIFLIIFLKSNDSFLKIPGKYFLKLNKKIIYNICKIGFPSFLRNFLSSFTAVLVYQKLSLYGGAQAIGVFGTVNKVIMFIFMPSFGIIQGLQPIIGFNYGAKQYDRVIEATKLGLKLMTTYFICGSLVIMFLPQTIISLFTTDKEFVELGAKSMRTMLFLLPLLSVPVITSTYFQATGKAKEAFLTSMSRQFIFFIPLLYILPNFASEGNELSFVFLTFPISDLFGTILSGAILLKSIKKMKKMTYEKVENA